MVTRRNILPIPALALALCFLATSALATRAQTPVSTPPSTVLKSDNFNDPSAGILPRSLNGNGWHGGYIDGEYQLAITDPALGGALVATAFGNFADVVVDVDARLLGGTLGRWDGLGCRRQANSVSGYRFEVSPSDGVVFLVRLDDGANKVLGSELSSTIRSGNETNHLQLTCSGSTISGSVNGTLAISLQDPTYQRGGIAITAGIFNEFLPATSDARFDNLVLKQAPGSSAGGSATPGDRLPTGLASVPPTNSPPPPRNVFESYNFADPGARSLPAVSPSSYGEVGYVDGEYRISKADPNFATPFGVGTDTYADSMMAVDARLVGDAKGRIFVLGCRMQTIPQGAIGYRLDVSPVEGVVVLMRADKDAGVILASRNSNAIQPDNQANHLELSCSGNTISAKINGTTVISAEDATYQRGAAVVAVGVLPSALPATAELRLSSLVISQP